MNNIRHAVRAVVFDQDSKIAVLEVNSGDHYKIPGGKIEKGEKWEEALRREVREEAGCEIEILEKIGGSEFLSENGDMIHRSTCFIAKCTGKKFDPTFDEFEMERSFKLLWVNPDEVNGLFQSTHPKNFYDKTITARDLGFIQSAIKILKK